MEKLTTKEKVQIALDRLDDGIRDFFRGDHYKEYLATMSKLHHYSARNCIWLREQSTGCSMKIMYRSGQVTAGRL